MGCTDLDRQFEFIQKEWINAPRFQGLPYGKDPIVGDHDRTDDMTILHKPVEKTPHDLPRFLTVKGRSTCCYPGCGASLARQRLIAVTGGGGRRHRFLCRAHRLP